VTLAEAMRQALVNTGLDPDPDGERHLCTDYELCPVCWLCLACCLGHGS
jgi:hypothetical protein